MFTGMCRWVCGCADDVEDVQVVCGNVQIDVWDVQMVCGDVQIDVWGCADGVWGCADGVWGCADGVGGCVDGYGISRWVCQIYANVCAGTQQRENKQFRDNVLRLEEENCTLAQEVVESKVELRAQMDKVRGGDRMHVAVEVYIGGALYVHCLVLGI